MKFLQPKAPTDKTKPGYKLTSNNDSPESQSGQYLLGMLVMQDVQLGVLIALLPAFGDSDDSDRDIVLCTILILLKTVGSFFVVMGKSYFNVLTF